MSRMTAAAVRFVHVLSGVLFVTVFCLLSPPALHATTTAAPQLLPYTVSIVAGGGTYGGSSKYTVGNTCGTNTGTTSPTALSTVGDGCLATQVYFSGNAAVADSEGNVFIIDYTNKLIRRVDAHTGIITTVAGATTTAAGAAPTTNPAKGANCSASDTTHLSADAIGDGCLATEVVLTNPEAIALDAQGNVWFTDKYLGSVREIVKSTGIIQTVVNQSFVTPPSFSSNGLTPTAGVGYVGYNANNSHLSTPITGVTAAQGLLYEPYGLAFDKQGNLYIADEYNNVVDVVNLGSATTTIAGISVPAGQITTIAGSGCTPVYETYIFGETASSSTTPKVSAMSCSSAYGTSNGTSPYPSTGAGLDSPYQVAVDNSGNIYIADEYPYDVRVINGATGDISTFAGVVSSKLSGAITRGLANATKLDSIFGVATDSQGNVYIANYNSSSNYYANYIARVDIATGDIYPIAGQLNASTTAPTADTAQAAATYCTGATHAVGSGTLPDVIGDGCPGLYSTFWKPYFPSVDAAGNVYVADQGDALIRKISVGTQFPAVVAGGGASVTHNIDVHFGAGDTPLGTSPNYTGTFTLPNPDTFQGFTLGSITSSTLPTSSTCTTNSDTTTDCVLQVTFQPPAGTAGLLTAPLTVTSAAGLVSSFALTGSGLGPALAVDPGNAMNLLQGTANPPSLAGVNSIALDHGNNVYATVPGTNPVVKIDSSGTVTKLTSGTATANAVTVDAAGNVYVALANGVIMELPGGVATNAVQFASGFTTPSGLAVDAIGNLYVADSAANTVTEILAGTGAETVLVSGQVTLAGGSTLSISVPNGLAVDTYGNLFIADTNANAVVELPYNSGTAVQVGSGLSAPEGVALDAAGSLYIADKGNKRIVYVPNEGGTLNSSDQIVIQAGLGAPTGVAIYTDGTLYVSDSANNLIYQITRGAASINLGNALTAIGDQSAATVTGVADIISMGNQAATFGTNFWTKSGADNSNTGSFGLSPSTIPNSTLFPAAGYGVELTPSFTPQALGALSATFTFNSTNFTAPTLTLTGSGSQPHDTTTTTVNAPAPSGQSNWIYGQTVLVNAVVSVDNGLLAPTSNVALYQDGGTTPIATLALTPGSAAGVACTSIATCQSTVQFSVTGLNAAAHNFTAIYGGDNESSASTSAELNLTVNPAPLTVTVNPASKNFDAPIPTPVTTGSLDGTQNGDSIGVTYSTAATAGSPVGTYLISAQVTGDALTNYTVTVAPNGPGGAAGGTLTVLADNTVTLLGTNLSSVNSTQTVTLTATVSNQNSYSVVTIPAGTVTFYNSVNGGTAAQIGSPATINPATGIASIQTTFAVVGGATTSNSVTAVYSDTVDSNFVTSTSAPIAIQSGVPSFGLVPASTHTQLTVAPGQSGLTSFTLTPVFGYNGTISFSCTTPSTTVSCAFSPQTVSPGGLSTATLVTLTIDTKQQVSPVSNNNRPSGILGAGKLPLTLAALPGLALLFGFSRRRRKFLRSFGVLLFAALCLFGLGLSGCSGGKIVAGTPAGSESITVVATGTGGSFAGVTHQFSVTLTVQ